MKRLILLFSIIVFYDCTYGMRRRESPGGRSPPIASPARESSPGENLPRASPLRESLLRVSPSRASPSRESPSRASPLRPSLPRGSATRASPSRASLSRASLPRASPPRENSPVPPALPDILPPNTRVFLQNRDGEVFSGRLTYMSGLPIPPWVFDPNKGANRVENVYVNMPNGDGLLSNIQPVRHHIDINDEIPEEHRLFILYGNGNVLVAVPQRYDEFPKERHSDPKVFLRIPQDSDRYFGVFGHFRGHRPSWLE